jgi:hypothetical protein
MSKLCFKEVQKGGILKKVMVATNPTKMTLFLTFYIDHNRFHKMKTKKNKMLSSNSVAARSAIVNASGTYCHGFESHQDSCEAKGKSVKQC